MTLRAVILGLAGAAVICGATYVNDHVIRQTYLVGSSMPTGIYGGLVLFILLLNPAIALVGLSVVVHRQWSSHEQLPYPIAMFTDSLLSSGGDAKSSVFRDRLFWCGCGTVLAIHMVNYGCVWWPDRLVQIPRRFSFASLAPLFPTLVKGGGWGLFVPTIYRRLKPLMFGLIAGDMLAGVGTSIIGGIFYLVTGAAPPQFAVLVG